MSVSFTAGQSIDTDIDDLVNFSNANAAMLLEHLGLRGQDAPGGSGMLAEDMVGEADAEDFLGRVLLAKALVPTDEGTPTVSDVMLGRRMLHMGRRPGYTQAALAELEQVALDAKAKGVPVMWA